MSEQSIIRWIWGVVVALLIGSMALAGLLASHQRQSAPPKERSSIERRVTGHSMETANELRHFG